MTSHNKYRNQKTVVDNITFDSKKEANRYSELKLLKMGGVIRDLELQPKIPLIVNGKNVGSYVGDFRYWDVEKGERVLEDVKSGPTKTPVYQLKKKILLTYNPPLEIIEV
jgi:hypothetical protein